MLHDDPGATDRVAGESNGGCEMKILNLGALVGLLLSGAAVAQTPSGRAGMSTDARAANVNAYRELQILGVCFARSQRPNALAVIATAPGSREETEVLRRRFYGERDTCTLGGSEIQMSYFHARGAIAEGLLKTGGASPEIQRPAPATSEIRTLVDAGLCFASTHRAQAQGLLETLPGTPEETAAVTALWQNFRTCIPGFQIRLNAIWIRYIIAEGLLRLAPASSPTPTG
jgi:hypothetical protein